MADVKRNRFDRWYGALAVAIAMLLCQPAQAQIRGEPAFRQGGVSTRHDDPPEAPGVATMPGHIC